ncbi:MAG: 3-deoxy-D-manno-octulosonic acid transferase [Acidobacteria bacterium]|nr:3-deoxy-D-manno-octulosonic acid transferase [Acidobacteriota bacterium]
MYLLYSLMLVAWGVLLLPAFLYKAWRRDKGFTGVPERLGRLPDSLRSDGRRTFWLHACSVGETLSLQPLVRELARQFPETRLVFSSITPTGRSVARERFSRYGNGNTFYFPVDLACIVGRVLDHIRPCIVIAVDTEIWPNLLHQACRRRIPVVLVNGRISDASYPGYRRGRFFLKKVLPQYRSLLMQSEQDAARMEALGAPREKTVVTGNMKFDAETIGEETGEVPAGDLKRYLGPADAGAPLIVAGSTHPGEEAVLFEVLLSLRRNADLQRTRLLVAPRHPERFDAVARLAVQNGLRVKRRSEDAGRNRDDAEVLLLDTMGELAAAYRYATAVFVGGTLTRHGGHSIMEPALCCKAIVVGPYMENFRAVLPEFFSNGAIRQVRAGEGDRESQIRQLSETFLELLRDPGKRDAMGAAARRAADRSRGAVRKTAAMIAAIIKEDGR